MHAFELPVGVHGGAVVQIAKKEGVGRRKGRNIRLPRASVVAVTWRIGCRWHHWEGLTGNLYQ
jgi:hypothetical protein